MGMPTKADINQYTFDQVGISNIYIYIYIIIYIYIKNVKPLKQAESIINIIYIYIYIFFFIEGSLEVKLPTIWRDEKQSREEA